MAKKTPAQKKAEESQRLKEDVICLHKHLDRSNAQIARRCGISDERVRQIIEEYVWGTMPK